MAEPGTVNVGDIAKDNITGFEGVVIAVTQWLSQCNRITIAPQKLTKDGAPIEHVTFDEPEVTVVKKGAFPKQVPAKRPLAKTGGPKPEPTRRATPQRRS